MGYLANVATEKEANIARNKFSTSLRNLGAHAIGVDQIKLRGKNTFAVIAFVDKKSGNVPNSLDIVVGEKSLKVPLVLRLAERFKAEKL
ncbi:MAG TPA: hypothetical protein VIU12_08540 [Chryseolinea sp.]